MRLVKTRIVTSYQLKVISEEFRGKNRAPRCQGERRRSIVDQKPGSTTTGQSNSGSSSNASTGSLAAKSNSKIDNAKLDGALASMTDRDGFQEAALKFAEWLGKNSMAVLALLGVVIMAGLGWVGYGKYLDHVEKSAVEAVYPIESQFQAKREAFEEAEAPQNSGVKSEGVKATGDLSKDYGQLVDDMAKFAVKNARTGAGAHAALIASDVYVKYGKTEEAKKLLAEVVGSVHAQSLFGGLVILAHGNVMAETGQCEGALTSFQKLLGSEEKSGPHSYLRGEAQLRAGLCFEKLGQKERAIEMYKKTIELKERGGVIERARTLLRALEIGA